MRLAAFIQSAASTFAVLAISHSALALQGCPAADYLEPNNDCNSTATPITNYQFYNLTVTGPQSPLGVDPDFFSITVPALSQIRVEAFFQDSNGDIDTWLWDAASGNCPSHVPGEFLANGFSTTDNEIFTWENNTALPVDCIIGVQYFSSTFNCNNYTLRPVVTPLLACPAPDRFEPNEDCATSTQLAVGATNTLSITGDINSANPDSDYYHYTLDNNEVISIDVWFEQPNGDIDCRLDRGPGCNIFADDGQTVTDNENVTYVNDTGVAQELTLRVYGYDLFSPDPHCADYRLNVTVDQVPCASAVEDVFAPNQSCATAVPMVEGFTDSLFVNKANSDYFQVLLANNEHLAVTTYFQDDVSDLDLALFDHADPGCGSSGLLVLSQGTSNIEYVTYVNISGAPMLVDIKVYVWTGLSNPDCNNYHMEIETTLGSVGFDVCFGDGSSVPCPCSNDTPTSFFEGCKNSTGRGARLVGAGSTSVGTDNLVLSVTEAAPSMPGIFVQGDFMGGVPLKDGVFCLGNPTTRLSVVFTDANGECSSDFSVVTEGGVLPGQTRYYQYWYRDSGGGSPCGTGSNFSSGLRVDYTP